MATAGTSKAAVVTIDTSGTIVSTNTVTLDIFGYASKDDLVGRNVSCLCAPPYDELHDSYMERYHRTGKERIIGKARRVEGKDTSGRVFPVLLEVTRLDLPNRLLFVGKIRKLEDLSAMMMVDTQGLIMSTNEAFTNITGYREEEVRGLSVGVLTKPPHRDKHAEYIANYLATGHSNIVGKVRNLALVRRDGASVDVTMQVRERRLDDGNVTFIASFTEVAESTEAVFSTTEACIITSCNAAVTDVFGYTQKELIGKNVAYLMPEKYARAHDKFVRRYQMGGNSVLMGRGARLLQGKHKDGSTFDMYLDLNEFHVGGGRCFAAKITRVSGLRPPSPLNMEDEKVINQRYRVSRFLGSGVAGQVYSAVDLSTREKVAIKFLTRTEDSIYDVAREVSVLKRLNHSHIIQYRDVFEDAEGVYVVMTYAGGGPFLSYVLNKTRLNEHEARSFARQLVSAVDYLHRLQVVHRDIKFDNLMLNELGKVVLIDFSLATTFQESQRFTDFCGTAEYSPPEIWAHEEYLGPPVDVWALGVVLYGMTTGMFAFTTPQQAASAQYELPEYLSDQLKDLLQHIFVIDPAQRATIDEIRAHPWINVEHQHLPSRKPIDGHSIESSGSSGSSAIVLSEGSSELHSLPSSLDQLSLHSDVSPTGETMEGRMSSSLGARVDTRVSGGGGGGGGGGVGDRRSNSYGSPPSGAVPPAACAAAAASYASAPAPAPAPSPTPLLSPAAMAGGSSAHWAHDRSGASTDTGMGMGMGMGRGEGREAARSDSMGSNGDSLTPPSARHGTVTPTSQTSSEGERKWRITISLHDGTRYRVPIRCTSTVADLVRLLVRRIPPLANQRVQLQLVDGTRLFGEDILMDAMDEGEILSVM